MSETAITEMIDVTVKVPAARLPDFYEMLGRWLSGATDRSVESEPPILQTWSEEDVDLLGSVVRKMSKPARRLLDCLACKPDFPWNGDGLAGACQINNGKYGIAGTLAWPMKYCKSINRPLPLEVQTRPDGETLYVMSPEMKDLYEATGEAFKYVAMKMAPAKEGQPPRETLYFVDE